MHLRSQPLSDAAYYEQAHDLQQQIQKVIESPAQHLGVRRIQDLFRENAARLYHWVEDRRVPADNNRAERELRPTVIARKTSFGSQSALVCFFSIPPPAPETEALRQNVKTICERYCASESTSEGH